MKIKIPNWIEEGDFYLRFKKIIDRVTKEEQWRGIINASLCEDSYASYDERESVITWSQETEKEDMVKDMVGSIETMIEDLETMARCIKRRL
jgi:hypothetical protein